MAKTKQAGSTRLGRDSESKRLGVKLFGGQSAHPGNILIRQRGLKYLPGLNVRRGGDDSLYAMAEGKVSFRTVRKRRFDGSIRHVKEVSVLPADSNKPAAASSVGRLRLPPSSAARSPRWGSPDKTSSVLPELRAAASSVADTPSSAAPLRAAASS